MSSLSSSYWCYGCSRYVRVWTRESVVCPHCDGGFVEEIDNPGRSMEDQRHGFPDAPVYRPTSRSTSPGQSSPRGSVDQGSSFSRRNRGSAERSPFNPVIVLRGSPGEAGRGAVLPALERGRFELYYDDGVGSGLRPLPSSMSEFLMGSGFERLLGQLGEIDVNGVGRCENPPASKSAVEAMPTIKIVQSHISCDSHCAVFMDPFELDAEAREMPCKHIYHSDCILPWLSMHNSCPVCRHELPTDVQPTAPRSALQATDASEEEDTVRMTIWRLPGGGFAVGRFSGGRRPGEGELPVVYMEMDGDLNSGAAARRVPWVTVRSSSSRPSGGVGQAFRRFFSFFRWVLSSSSRSSNLEPVSSPRDRNRTHGSALSRPSRQRGPWAFEHGSGVSRWG